MICIIRALGNLDYRHASMPHPQGTIKVDLTKTKNNGIQGIITLHPGLNGTFVWNDKTIVLHEGLQKIFSE